MKTINPFIQNYLAVAILAILILAGETSVHAQRTTTKAPRSVQAVVDNAADDFVHRAMDRFKVGDVPLGAASVSRVETVVTDVEVEPDGDYAVTANVKWKTLLTGGTSFRAQLLVRVNPNDMSWLVIPENIDPNARAFLDTGAFAKDALLNMATDHPVWKDQGSALQMFRGKAPSLPEPPPVTLDGPRVLTDSSTKSYVIADHQMRVNFVRSGNRTMQTDSNGMPSWAALSAQADAAEGDLLAVGDEQYQLQIDPGTTCMLTWRSEKQSGFAAVLRTQDGSYYITDNGEKSSWRRLDSLKNRDGFWWKLPNSDTTFDVDFTIRDGGSFFYRARFGKH